MMIIFSLTKILTIHTHTHIKKDVANTNNYRNVLTQYAHYIPYVYTIVDYNDVHAIYN